MNAKVFGVIIIGVVVVAGGIYFLNRGDNGASLTPDSNQTPQTANPEPAPVPQAHTPPTPATPQSAVPPPSAPQPSPVPQVQAPVTHSVNIQNFAFNISSITIKKGDTVVWTNSDSAPHTVTGDTGGSSSPTLNTGGTYRFTFNSAGTFPYHCSFHPSMTGSVTVAD